MIHNIMASFTSSKSCVTASRYKYDYGQRLVFNGIPLPSTYEVHFSNEGSGQAKTVIGNEDGVLIPDEYFLTGETVYAWLFLHDEETDGRTMYKVKIPVINKAKPIEAQPTPVEQDVITQAIAALNHAVELSEENVTHYPKIEDGTWHVWDAEANEWSDTGIEAQGEKGDKGDRGDKGDKGDTGATGARGESGADGFSPVVTVTEITGGHNVSIEDAEQTQTFDVMDGVTPVIPWDSILPVDTASGSIASFPDGTDLVPAKSVVIGIEPIQDLHGYDKPWIGGNGKNKCSLKDVTFTQYIEKEIEPIPSGTYIFTAVVTSTDTDSNQCAVIFLDADKNTLASKAIGRSASSTERKDTSSFTVSVPIKYIRFYASSGYPSGAGDTASFNDIQIESGSTATSYEPYSNICPISGWTGAEVNVSGFNVWDEEWELGKYDANGQKVSDSSLIRSKNYISVVPNTAYYILVPYASYVAGFAVINYYDSDKNFLSRTNVGSNGVSFTTPSNARYVTFFVSSLYGTTYSHDISINYPSTDHEYHAYHGETKVVEFKDENDNVLTVYGGNAEIVSGQLTSEMGMTTVGALNWTKGNRNDDDTGYIFRTAVTGVLNTAIYSSAFKSVVTPSRWEAMHLGEICRPASYICICADYETASEFKTANADAQICYKLATPQTYQLTPQEVTLLLGENNIWADCGDTEVTYNADIQRYISKVVNA